MVHGNHEGFAHLQTLIRGDPPANPIRVKDLPGVDTNGHIRYLGSGWRCVTSSGLVVAGVGGIERGQRGAKYHELAYLDELAIELLREGPAVDVLITHQGPSSVQGNKGSELLQSLLDAEFARVWFHGHSIPNRDMVEAGPNGATLVVPLADVAFGTDGHEADEPGRDGWACAEFGETVAVTRERPAFWREYRRKKWLVREDGQLVCPDLAGPLARFRS
jgi:hypothetical protein